MNDGSCKYALVQCMYCTEVGGCTADVLECVSRPPGTDDVVKYGRDETDEAKR